MPSEQGYDRQLTPQTAAAQPLTSPEDYGAGIGEAIGQLGATVHQTKVRAFQIEKKVTADRELAQGAARLADWTTKVSAEVARREIEYGPGHDTAVETMLGTSQQEVLDGITDEAVRRNLEGQVVEFGARQRLRAEVVVATEGAKQVREGAARTLDTLDNGINNAADPLQALLAANEQWGMFTGGLHNIGEYDREMVGREGEARMTTTALAKNAALEPEKTGALVKSGIYNDLLTAKQMAHVVQSVAFGKQAKEVEQREAALAKKRAVIEVRTAAEQRLETIAVLIDNGEPPAISEISAAIAAGREAGIPPADLLKYSFMGEAAGRSRQLKAMPTAGLQQRAAPLRQAQAAGQLDAAGERELKQINATIEGRSKQAGEQLGALWKAGPDGQRQVIAQLHGMPLSERQTAAAQLGDRAFLLGSLSAEAAETIRHGAGVRNARPNDFLPALTEGDKGSMDLARAGFNNILGRSVINQLGEAYDDMLDATLDYYVAKMEQRRSADGFDLPLFQKSIRVVFGATVRPNGVVQGGIAPVRGRMVELPHGWTAGEFDFWYSRVDFAALGARYANGKPVNSGDVRAHYTPVVDDEDDGGNVQYRLEDSDGRPLPDGKGGVFRYRVSRNPPGGR